MIKFSFYCFLVFISLLYLSQISLVQCKCTEAKQGHNKTIYYTAYQNSSFCQPSNDRILEPRDKDQVLQYVREAIAKNLTVKAIGSRHSTTDIICTNGVAICMKNIKHMEMNLTSGIVTVDAGVTLENLGLFLNASGRAIEHIPSFMGITIGGAIGTGAHGSSLKHKTAISDYVVGVKIIDGLGQIRQITESEELRAFMIHLGLLGVILEIQLITVPQFKLIKKHVKMSDSYLNQTENGKSIIVKWAREYNMFEIFWFPSWSEIIVCTGNYTSINAKGNAHTNFIPPVNLTTAKLITEATEFVQKSRNYHLADAMEWFTKEGLYRPIIGKPHIFEEENGRFANPATGLSYKMMSSNCHDKCLWHYEEWQDVDNSFSMNVNDFVDIINNLKECIGKVRGDFALQGIYIRFSQKQEALMSKGFDRDLVHIEWITMKRKNPFDAARLGLATFQAMSLSLVNNFGARAHWGKNGPYYHNKENIIKSSDSENLEKFKEIMIKYDPNGVFHNKFAKRLLQESDDRDLDDSIYKNPQDFHCALMDECENATACHKDNDCDSNQFCKNITLDDTKLKMRLFSVCYDRFQEEYFKPIKDDYQTINNYIYFLINVLNDFGHGIEVIVTSLPTLLPIFGK